MLRPECQRGKPQGVCQDAPRPASETLNKSNNAEPRTVFELSFPAPGYEHSRQLVALISFLLFLIMPI